MDGAGSLIGDDPHPERNRIVRLCERSVQAGDESGPRKGVLSLRSGLS
jgi:hypothetical protein